jgi:hypothetical protein
VASRSSRSRSITLGSAVFIEIFSCQSMPQTRCSLIRHCGTFPRQLLRSRLASNCAPSLQS